MKLKKGINQVFIKPTGWTRDPNIYKGKNGIYYATYISHSDFTELVDFVKSIKPAVLRSVNIIRDTEDEHFPEIEEVQKKKVNSHFTWGDVSQRGLAILIHKFVDFSRASQEYLSCFNP